MTAGTLEIPASAALRRRRRASAVAGAVAAALVVYALARLFYGQLRQPAFGAAESSSLGPGVVAVAATIAGLLGWTSVGLLERAGRQAARIWLLGAPLVLLASLSAPLSGHGVSGGNRLALVLMHLAAGSVLIPALWTSSPTWTRISRLGRSQ